MKRTDGFTLVELMIAIAILAIVSAIAIPAYNGYIRESRLGALRMNLDTLRIAVEGYRLDRINSNYGPTQAYTTVAAISNQYGWKPEGSGVGYVYAVRAVSAATPIFCLTGTKDSAWVRCVKGNTPFCTDGTTGSPSASCP
jgi:type IV pilus assembly protein PilE